MPRTLRSQVQALSVLPILCLGAVAIGASVLLTRHQVGVEARRNLEEVSNLLASRTRDRAEALSAQTKLIADLPSFQAALASGDPKVIRDRSAFFIKRAQADALIVTDPKGRPILWTGVSPAKALSPQLLALVRSAGQPTSPVVTVAQDGRLFAAASAPVVAGGKQVGVLIGLSSVGNKLAVELQRATSAHVMLIWNGRTVGTSLAVAEAPNLDGADPRRVSLNGTQYMAVSRPLPGADPELGARVVTLRSFEALAQPYRALSTMFVVLLGAALIIAAILAKTFAAGIMKPLDSLLKSAQIVRDGNWPPPLYIERDDEIGFLQSVFNDMTAALRDSQERLINLVDTDPLTGLDNHRRFKERLDQEVFRACMSTKPLVLAIVDFDKFGEYNTQYGHAAGDQALRTISKLLSEVAPDIAFLARYGGEEFAMLLPLTDLEGAEAILYRLRELAKDKFLGPLTFSVGLADVTNGITTGAGLLLSAEMALHRGKQLGRDRICRFDAVPGASSADDPFQLQQYLEDTTLSTIQTLAGAVDAKDPYTQGHSVRVARYACDLARYMNYPAHFIDLVYKTGTLHDVGKIGVPDSILSKPSRLEPEEQAIMETHAVLGELIVKKAPQLQEMLPGVRHHHERWDGRGYPDGLAGTQIPLLGRLIAVADTFDAMTSDRPYRKALPDDVAIEEIRRKAGTQFDPELAEAFVSMMRLSTHGQRAA